MDQSIILITILFVILISLQYSLNVIIALLKDIKTILIRLRNNNP